MDSTLKQIGVQQFVDCRFISTAELSKKVWTNDLILQEITGYLTISDLKKLSQVNQYLLERVRSLTRFTSLAGQVVTGQMDIHTFKLSKAIVEVNKLEEKALQEKAPEVFQDTEYLELQCLDNLRDEDRNSRLIQIVSSCSNLKSLVIGKRSCIKYNFETFLEDSNVKSIFSHIKELRIGIPHKAYTENFLLNEEPGDWEYWNALETFKLFSSLQLTLEKFSCLDPGKNNLYPELILNTSLKTLTDLTLSIHVDGLERLCSMNFTGLRKFKLEVFGSHETPPGVRPEINYSSPSAGTLFSFLRNHSSTLTEFVLHSCKPFLLESFGEVLKSMKKLKGALPTSKKDCCKRWCFTYIEDALEYTKTQYASLVPDREL